MYNQKHFEEGVGISKDIVIRLFEWHGLLSNFRRAKANASVTAIGVVEVLQ